ncbi:MAG: carboxypeptidase-like regulatory domain-containing protein, partial [Gammaproteobacteria bacterium]|nr:carboxypeptidase-like regulatory domain-containing protein [Gammaproteobacteria bacterium]
MSLPASNSNRFLKLTAFMLLFAALPAAAHAQGSLEGTVRDAATNQGVVGAQVFISALNIGSLTDNDGSFSIGGVPAGSHIVEIQPLGGVADQL